MKKSFIFLIMTAFLSAGCQNAASKSDQKSVELQVMAAASLTDALAEIETLYEKKHKNLNVIINYASSGTLQKQIEQGAPADIFLSAGSLQMEALNKKGLIKEGTITNYLENELVLIVPIDRKKEINSFDDLKKQTIQSLSIGQPETVPAGSYAKEALQSLHLWETVSEKIVYAKDVRQVLTYVETKNVDAGLVYRTDANQSKKISVINTVPAGSHEPITYPIGIIKNTSRYDETKAFYEWLHQEKALAIFESYGFKGVNKRSVQ